MEKREKPATKLCRHCKTEIPYDAKICPNCRKKQKGMGCLTTILIVLAFFVILIVIGSSGSNKKSVSDQPTNSAGKDTEAAVLTDSGESIDQNASEQQEELPFTVEASKEGLSVGQISKDGDFYVGLSAVKKLGYVQTGVEDYTEEVASDHEVLYVLTEVYNASDDIHTFNDISVYADSIQLSPPDTIYLCEIDGISEYDSYKLDGGTCALILQDFEVEKGWSELTVYAGHCSWTVTADEVNDETYQYTSLFHLNSDFETTAPGTVVYEEDYEVTYDDFEVYAYSDYFENQDYAVFKFTVNNTSAEELDYSLVGYNMRGYEERALLEGATYVMDDNIDGYTNIYEIDSIKPGMKSQLYVAFPVLDNGSDFQCVFDTGFIINEALAVIYAKAE